MNMNIYILIVTAICVAAVLVVDALEVLRQRRRSAGTVSLKGWLTTLRAEWDAGYWLGMVKYSAAVLCILFLLLCVVSPVRVVGSSMDSTLHSGQLVVVTGVKYNPLAKVNHGDIVTVNSRECGQSIIKRVIALPGDTFEIRENRVYVNGVALEEDYLPEPMVTQDIPAFTLGEDEYFVMGDNRNISLDSRRIGPVTEEEIVGIAIFDISGLSLMPGTDTFSALEQARLS